MITRCWRSWMRANWCFTFRRVGLGCMLAMPLAGVSAPMTIAVSRTPLSLPLYVAEAEKFFSAENVDVVLRDCMGGNRCMREVEDGAADYATAPDVPIALWAFQPGNWSIVATFATAANDVKIVARKGTRLAEVPDWARKRIGMTPVSASQYFLETVLLTIGVDPATVATVPLPPETLAEALNSGKVDAISVWEPFAHSAVQASKGDLAVVATRGVYRETFNLVAANKHVMASSAETARLLRAIDRANTFIAEHPARAQAVLRARLGVDDAFIQSIWPNVRYRLSLDQGLLKTLESEARWAIRESHVKADRIPNFLPLFHTAPMLSVKPDSAGIAR